MQIRRWGVAVCVISGLALSEAVYASPSTAVAVPVRAMFSHDKTVQFAVRNETTAELKLKCGEELVTIAPGKVTQVKLAVGSRVTFAEASGSHAAGDLLAQAGMELRGTTIAVR